ncbi:hypothetical protein [Thermomonas sp.]|uniref:hypothetical protein n=1 Tax=Thermomonas sp. TaxID=1971895 RepID=UPI001ACBB61B|nr:hypothetical protein [Xanthomonadales bacterium]MBN8768510.1 hypothetical protein [Stenotrophomonas sp.]
MKVRILMLAAALVAVSVSAEEVPFKGRTLEVDTGQEARPILKVDGSRYVVPGSREQLVAKARACLAAQEGVSMGAVDAEQGQLAATMLTGFRASFANQALRTQLAMEVGDGYFHITQSAPELAQTDGSGFVPLGQSSGPWEKALDALVKHEDALIDCMYR